MDALVKMRASLKPGKTSHIRKCNFTALMLTVYLGGIQFGIIISWWNVAWKPFAYQYGLDYNLEGN